eukprot:TRINITY_DN1242_c0_g1_i1.p1 TRINITY_DN1242_c0_g1~~TRINITY_DN1242_c0_g1_i1.p1  ORF type:complete len:562 (+),score=97.90 TRINITY_DN1242_c0_g1_i1:142-1827(+)
MAHCSFFGSAVSEIYGLNHVCGATFSTFASSSQPKRLPCDMVFIRHDKFLGIGQSEKGNLSSFLQKRNALSTIAKGMRSEVSAPGGPLSPSQPPPTPVPVDRADSLVTGATSSVSAPLSSEKLPGSSRSNAQSQNALGYSESVQEAAQGRRATPGVEDRDQTGGNGESQGGNIASWTPLGEVGEASTPDNPPAVWTTLLTSPPNVEVAARSEDSDSDVGAPEVVWTALLSAIGRSSVEERESTGVEESSIDETQRLVEVQRGKSEVEGVASSVSASVIVPVMPDEKAAVTVASVPASVAVPIKQDEKVGAAVASVSAPEKDAAQGQEKAPSRIRKVHNQEQFDEALRLAGQSLVVVQFAGKSSKRCQALFPDVVEFSRKCTHIIFLLVVGDESEATRELCKSQGVRNPPHFTFFRNSRRIHDMFAANTEELQASILYYSDKFAPLVQQLESVEAWEALVAENKQSDKLAVVDVSMHNCGPCVRVYPTLINLSRKMSDIATFARIVGDDNESLHDLLRELNIVEVPTFLFLRHGELVGRYVGSGKGELVGEILRYQGVRITY